MSRILPVSFSLPLVRRIRSGDKVETRRPVRYDFGEDVLFPASPGGIHGVYFSRSREFTGHYLTPPHGDVGDLLYVRETARVLDYPNHGLAHVRYEADGAEAVVSIPERIKFTPIGQCLANGAYREACRTWLEVTGVRVERLNEIDDDGAIREGIDSVDGRWAFHDAPREYLNPSAAFHALWDTFYTGPKSWASNPFVWIYAFRMVDAPSSL